MPEPTSPKQDPNAAQLRNLRNLFRVYIAPLLVLVVFLVLLFGLILPSISRLFSALDQLGLLLQEVESTNAEIQSLQLLTAQKSELQSNLSLVDKTIPSGATLVTDFQQKITGLAASAGLKVIETTTEEQILKIDEDQAGLLGIIEIPSTFSLQGRFNSIQNFIEQIGSIEDFVIIGEMDLGLATGSEVETIADASNKDWALEIILVKYQFQVLPADQLRELFLQIPVTKLPNQKVLQFIQDKYQVGI